MSFTEFITDNFIMIAELVGIWVLMSISIHVSKRSINITRLATALLLLNSILTNVELWTQSFETLSIWRPILTGIIYSLNPLILILVMYITMPISKRGFLIAIPELVCIPIFLTTQWTHIVCYYREDNHYLGGLIPNLPYFLFFFYIVAFVIYGLYYFKDHQRSDRMVFMLIVFMAVIGIVVYLLADFTNKFSHIFTSSILLYYLFLYIHMSKTDAMTGLLNRQTFYRDTGNSSQKISAVVSVDMNDLKLINDTKGHLAGDIAIKTVSAILRGNRNSNKRAYRIGGDEFVVLYAGVRPDYVVTDVDNMRNAMADTPYVCAFGTAFLFPGQSVDSALKDADKLMYANKSELKRAKYEAEGIPARRKGDIKQ